MENLHPHKFCINVSTLNIRDTIIAVGVSVYPLKEVVKYLNICSPASSYMHNSVLPCVIPDPSASGFHNDKALSLGTKIQAIFKNLICWVYRSWWKRIHSSHLFSKHIEVFWGIYQG